MNERMKNLNLACLLNGIMFGLIKLFYEIVQAPMSAILYCTFLGFTVTFAVGAQSRKMGAYLGSIVVGVLWVAGYIGFEYLFLLAPIPEIVAKVVAFGFMSFVIEIVNLRVIGKTQFKFVPLQFAVVISVFSQQGEHIAYVLMALIIGVLAALLSKAIYMKLLPTCKNDDLQ